MNPDDAVRREARFAGWLAEHRGIFVKIARAYAENEEDQADLYQDMLLQVWRSLAAFRDHARPSTWIYRVCLNTALTWRRDERQHRERIQARERLPDLPATEARPGQAHEETELVTQLYTAIRELEPARRSLVLLALDGLSYREIGEITGLTENNVGAALSRARGKLAERLKGVRHELE